MEKNLLPYQVLREERQKAGLSLRALGDILGVSSVFICDVEHGRRELGRHYYGKLPNQIQRAVVAAEIARLWRDIVKLRQDFLIE